MGSPARAVCAAFALSLSSAWAEAEPPAAVHRDLAERIVRAYHAGDVDELRPLLAPELVFEEAKSERRLELAGFLDKVGAMGAGQGDRELEIAWVGVAAGRADVRGSWSWTDPEDGRRHERRFSIELDFDPGEDPPRVAAWHDDFRHRGMWKPARGDGEHETEHFRIVFFTTELEPAEATRLGETFERWYDETRRYLDRSFAGGYRLHVNVADGHASPYATDPGPDAFILVSSRSARREYGFSLVHELTHNLMGLSWLSRHQVERDGVELASGNRLFDEGFAVFVEEELTGEGPRVWPNFGQETHAAYWQLRAEKGEPIWPVLDAEVQRQQGNRRLAYLAQASFCKYLVETHGLEKFLRLFDTDPAAAEETYGVDLATLELEWRGYLADAFGEERE